MILKDGEMETKMRMDCVSKANPRSILAESEPQDAHHFLPTEGDRNGSVRGRGSEKGQRQNSVS